MLTAMLCAVCKIDGIEALVKLGAKKDNPDMMEGVALACANLTASHPGNSQ